MVSPEIINNLLQYQYIYHLGEHPLILPWIYEPHIVTGSIVFGFFVCDALFDYLFWEKIRPYRNKLKERIKKCLKK